MSKKKDEATRFHRVERGASRIKHYKCRIIAGIVPLFSHMGDTVTKRSPYYYVDAVTKNLAQQWVIDNQLPEFEASLDKNKKEIVLKITASVVDTDVMLHALGAKTLFSLDGLEKGGSGYDQREVKEG